MADKIVISGENPSLTLYKPGTDQIIAKVSYWKSVFSEAGDGNATLIWVDPEASGLGDAAPHAIYTDNPAVARLVTDRFTLHFGGWAELGFATMEPTMARFFQEGDGRLYHRVVSICEGAVVELVWWDIIEQQLLQRPNFELGPDRWDLATVICPCKSALITVNNQRIEGEVKVKEGDERLESSAFLAFSETWRLSS